jgi:hypothetical protein
LVLHLHRDLVELVKDDHWDAMATPIPTRSMKTLLASILNFM